jgi:hypothetical protein
MKVRTNYPFIYFLIEPNVIFVYKIDSKDYLKVEELSLSGEWTTFELTDTDDFATFYHQEREPLIGRGYFLQQSVKYLMTEKINQLIQKHRIKKPSPVHIVSSDSAAGSLRYGLERPKTVIGFSAVFSIGPIWQLVHKTGQSLRNEWINENINFGMNDFEYENMFANKLLEIDDIQAQSPIYLWAANNGDEQTGLRFILYLLKNKSNDVFLIDTSKEDDKRFTAEMHPEELRDLFNKAQKPLSLEERIQYQQEWEALAETKGLLRLWQNERIEEVPVDYYDTLIINTIKEIHLSDFIKAGRVVGTVLSRMDEMVSDAFLEYRLRYLIYNGALALKGIPKSMRHYSVKVR